MCSPSTNVVNKGSEYSSHMLIKLGFIQFQAFKRLVVYYLTKPQIW